MTERIKIVHIIESLGRGGAERFLVTTLQHLDSSRFDSHVLYLFGRHELRPEVEGLQVPVECIEMQDFADWRRGLPRLRARLAALKPDIVHTVLQRSDIYGRIAAATSVRCPIISTLHECPYNPEVFIDSQQLNRVKYGAFKLLDKTTARMCNDAFIVVSEATRRNLQRYFNVNPARVRVLYSGIDLEAIDRSIGSEARIREELGLHDGQPVLLNVARLFQQKGQRYLIRAMRQVVDQVPNVRLLIRGDGGDRDELLAMIASLDLGANVTILDRYRSHAEILALLRICDVFVFPSLYEGLGIALIEALAVGRPCVASNVGPIPEVVDHGLTGLLVPSMDPPALAEALLSLLHDPERRRRMGAEGRRVVEARFDMARNVRLLEAAYDDLVAGRWMRSAATEESMQGIES